MRIYPGIAWVFMRVKEPSFYWACYPGSHLANTWTEDLGIKCLRRKTEGRDQ